MDWVWYGLGLAWVGFGMGWIWYGLDLVWVGFDIGLVWCDIGFHIRLEISSFCSGKISYLSLLIRGINQSEIEGSKLRL